MKGIVVIIFLFFIVWAAVWWVMVSLSLFPWQLKRELASGGSNLVLLDVRTPLEFDWFHLPEARNDPDVLIDSTKIIKVSPEQSVGVICMTSNRSPIVAYALKNQGFKKVYNLTWGM
jgi:rhodanese-related sulfurtransferase